MDYKSKYEKYKTKYLELKTDQQGGMIIEKNKYTEHVSEPWFTLISLGLKKVEGRKNKGRFAEMKVGDVIEWTNSDLFPRSVLTEITGKNVYQTFNQYLNSEGLENCLPGITNIKDGENVYYKYYTVDDERKYGVLAIKLKVI